MSKCSDTINTAGYDDDNEKITFINIKIIL